MLLPDDDSIELDDSDDGPLVVDRNDPPAPDLSSLRLLLPSKLRGGTSLPRDAVLQGWGAMSNLLHARAVFVLDAQLSPHFADGDFLDTIWGVPLNRKRAAGESDPTYRARLLGPRDAVTPAAIKGALDQLQASVTTMPLVYIEPAVDRMYSAPATASDPVVANSNNDPASPSYAAQSHGVVPDWIAFSQPIAGGQTENQTIYANVTRRLLAYYPDLANPNVPVYSTPVTKNGLFWIVQPVAAFDDSQVPHAIPVGGSDPDGRDYSAPATASDPVVANSNNDPASPSYAAQSHGVLPASSWLGYCGPARVPLADQMISEVESRKPGGTPWMLILDSLLQNAV